MIKVSIDSDADQEGGSAKTMDADTVFRIVAIASAVGVWALCVKNTVRYLLSKSDGAALLKRSLLSVGLFAAQVTGFVMLIDLAGITPASGYAVTALVLALVADAAFKRHCQAQERVREQMLENLRKAADAKQPMPLEEACGKAARCYNLTRREEEVLGLLLHGLSYAQMEERLCLSHSTVKSHVRNLYRKMEVNRRERLHQKVYGVQDDGCTSHRSCADASTSLLL